MTRRKILWLLPIIVLCLVFFSGGQSVEGSLKQDVTAPDFIKTIVTGSTDCARLE